MLSRRNPLFPVESCFQFSEILFIRVTQSLTFAEDLFWPKATVAEIQKIDVNRKAFMSVLPNGEALAMRRHSLLVCLAADAE